MVDYIDINHKPSIHGVKNNMKNSHIYWEQKNASNNMCLLDRNINSWDRNAEKKFYVFLKNMLWVRLLLFSGQNLDVLFSIYSDLQINISLFW